MEKEVEQDKEIANFHIPRWNELPNIELYVDQVICFLDDSLSQYIHKEKKGHVLTKTMINNYVKNSIILPTVNKKYNREHIANLFIICILKQIYSISDIAELIKLVTQNVSIENAYNSFCNELERSVCNVFVGTEDHRQLNKMTIEEQVLKNIVTSFTNKLYIDKIYLKK